MSFFLVTGRVHHDEHGRRSFVVEPELEGDLTGAEIHLSYAYETDDQSFALAAAVETTEAWSERGATRVRAFPHRLAMSWPAGSRPAAPEDRADAREELDRE